MKHLGVVFDEICVIEINAVELLSIKNHMCTFYSREIHFVDN